MDCGIRSFGLSDGIEQDYGHLLRPDKDDRNAEKKIEKTERPFTTALYVLRALEAGIRISDLDFFELGDIMDILVEHGNDGEHYDRLMTQEEMDRF